MLYDVIPGTSFPDIRQMTPAYPASNTGRHELHRDTGPISTNWVSRSRSELFSHARISSIFDSTSEARLELSFGAMIGLPLIHKLVKPIKVTGSRTTNKLRFNELLVTKTQPKLGAADASVLREANPTVR